MARKFDRARDRAPAGGQSRLPYVDTLPALCDKYLTYLLSGRKVPAFVVFFAMVWVFFQDNRQGHLKTFSDVLWTLAKCLCLVALYVAYWISSRFTSAHPKPKEPAIVKNKNTASAKE